MENKILTDMLSHCIFLAIAFRAKMSSLRNKLNIKGQRSPFFKKQRMFFRERTFAFIE